MSQPDSSSGNSGNSGNSDHSDHSGNCDNSGNTGNSGSSDNFRQPCNPVRGRWIRSRKPIGRTNFPPGQCICTRENALVVCNACGFFKTGRVHHSCPVHHQVSFITDMTECPKCEADYSALSEI